ncbi:hypothetical protein ACLLER_003115 [Listeria monocytogenes]
MNTVEASQETIWFTLINTVHQDFLFYRLISEIEIKKIKSIRGSTSEAVTTRNKELN